MPAMTVNTASVAVAPQIDFASFKATFGKTYSADEETTRAVVFADNVAYIEAHNTEYAAGKWTFDMGVNEFSDMTHEEFKAMMIGPKIPTRTAANVEILPKTVTLTGAAAGVDWRTKNAVTPVKNQGQCGSCWSFSTTGSTEGAVAIAGGGLTPLSEQQLMDCSVKEGDHSCQGGLMDYGFQYIIDNKGLDTEADYPYLAKNEACNAGKAKTVAATITAFKDVTPNSEDQLASAVGIGPVSVAIEADQRGFQSYKSGVFSGLCGTKLDHGVLAVGYTDEAWIVKNSWGASWGMNGFIQLAKGKGAAGECGIAAQPS
jgi:xylem cysteine proteinase